jgi:DNA-directed RNA polymerase subunit RPC12/RpoP
MANRLGANRSETGFLTSLRALLSIFDNFQMYSVNNNTLVFLLLCKTNNSTVSTSSVTLNTETELKTVKSFHLLLPALQRRRRKVRLQNPTRHRCPHCSPKMPPKNRPRRDIKTNLQIITHWSMQTYERIGTRHIS